MSARTVESLHPATIERLRDENERALKIRRAVLASKPADFRPDDDDFYKTLMDGWNKARAWFLAAGDDDERGQR